MQVHPKYALVGYEIKWEKKEVKTHRLHVRRKMKENNGKLKKIEASLIKKFMRINSQPDVSSILELSLSHSWTLRVFLEHFNFGSRKTKKAKRKAKIKQGRAGSSNYNGFTCR